MRVNKKISRCLHIALQFPSLSKLIARNARILGEFDLCPMVLPEVEKIKISD